MKKYYVCGFLFSDNYEKVVLIRKNKPANMVGLWNGLGGKIELKDESPLFAMIREFKEECGVEIKSWIEFCKISGDDFEVYFYKTTGDITKVKTMESEEVRVHDIYGPLGVFTRGELVSSLEWLLPMALDTHKLHGTVNYL